MYKKSIREVVALQVSYHAACVSFGSNLALRGYTLGQIPHCVGKPWVSSRTAWYYYLGSIPALRVVFLYVS